MNTHRISQAAFLLLCLLLLLLAAGLPLRRFTSHWQPLAGPDRGQQTGAAERSAEEPLVLSLLLFFQ